MPSIYVVRWPVPMCAGELPDGLTACRSRLFVDSRDGSQGMPVMVFEAAREVRASHGATMLPGAAVLLGGAVSRSFGGVASDCSGR